MRAALGLLIGLLAGCSKPARDLVYVDLRAIRPDPSINVTIPNFGKPIEFPSTSASIPALPARSVSLGNVESRLARARAIIARNRQEALAQITRELQGSYQRELNRLRRDTTEALDAERLANLQGAIGKVAALFSSYASRRGPLVARLAFLADFPDRDPNSKRAETPGARIENERIEEAKRLRAEIAVLDAGFDHDSSRIAVSIESESETAIVAFLRDLELKRVEADRRAEAEARRQIEADRPLRSIIENRGAMRLPAEPGKQITVPGGNRLPSPPTVLSPAFPNMLQNELQIWAETHYYQISASPQGARNATEEFKKWKQERSPGL